MSKRKRNPHGTSGGPDTPLSGEHPSSRYSAEAIAHASAYDLMRVTDSGLGFIWGMPPTYPEERAQKGGAK